MNLFKLLNANNYVTFNRPLAHAIGLNATIILSELLDKYEHFKNLDQLEEFPDLEGQWFYLTVDAAQERTTLGEKEQRGAIEKLEELGFITKKVKGIPGKRYFQIHEDAIEAYFKNSNKVSRTSQRPNCYLPKANLEPPEGQRIYKEPKEEPKEEPSSSSSLRSSSLDFKKEMMGMMKSSFSATDEEFEEAWSKYQFLDHSKIPHPKAWFAKVIINSRDEKNRQPRPLDEQALKKDYASRHKKIAEEKERKFPKSANPERCVMCLEEEVVMISGEYQKRVRYDVNTFEWEQQTGWDE